MIYAIFLLKGTKKATDKVIPVTNADGSIKQFHSELDAEEHVENLPFDTYFITHLF